MSYIDLEMSSTLVPNKDMLAVIIKVIEKHEVRTLGMMTCLDYFIEQGEFSRVIEISNEMGDTLEHLADIYVAAAVISDSPSLRYELVFKAFGINPNIDVKSRYEIATDGKQVSVENDRVAVTELNIRILSLKISPEKVLGFNDILSSHKRLYDKWGGKVPLGYQLLMAAYEVIKPLTRKTK